MSNRGDDRSRRRRHPASASPEQQPRSIVERVAVEAFVHLMRKNRVRHYDLVAERWTGSVTGPYRAGSRSEILRNYELAPPFWPLTTSRGRAALAGYGVNRDALCIRYEQMTLPRSGYNDGPTVECPEFGPAYRQLMQRASARNPAFLCERLPPWYAVQIVSEYLIEAALSLAEGRGPLIVENGSRPISG